ncbi:hypothetical protein AVEN_109153-1 [Araneus ventricosus]|uniref:Uncharacterized protein n=1 Tax=Araneus ventricosus TaxID=182803 RepID=A0A4Y2IU49_ARAVE|nr:hypothetical protein AVEN_109153-1 [Araneus ventricosus]
MDEIRQFFWGNNNADIASSDTIKWRLPLDVPMCVNVNIPLSSVKRLYVSIVGCQAEVGTHLRISPDPMIVQNVNLMKQSQPCQVDIMVSLRFSEVNVSITPRGITDAAV